MMSHDVSTPCGVMTPYNNFLYIKSIRSISLSGRCKCCPYPQTLLPMEFIFLVCSLLILISVMKILKKPKPNNNTSLLPPPPGPRKLPFIGNIHQLFGSALPHHTLRDLANKHGPLMHLKLGEIPVVVVSSPEMAKEVFRTHDLTFANRPITQASWTLSYNNSDVAFSPYGDLWRQLRKICTAELLTQKRVQEFRSIREDEVFSMIKSIISLTEEENQVVNLSRKIFELNHTIVARTAFGKISNYHQEFIAAMEAVLDLLGGFHVFDMFPSFKILQRISGFERNLEILHNQLDRIVGNILNEHKEKEPNEACERKEDVVDVLLNIQKHVESDVPLTDKSIKAVILDIFTAGGGTSSTTIEWAISELIRNPTIMNMAQTEVRNVYHGRDNVDESMLDELKYLQAVVKETLRLHPPAVLSVPRESITQCNIAGYEIAAKTTVLINAWAIGRDPKCWIHADKFDPDRFLDSKIEYKGNHFQYIPFGGGRRICPGKSYAISNIHLSLAQLLFHFDWKLPGEMIPEDLDMIEKYGLSVRRKNDLQLIPMPYHLSCLKGSTEGY